MILCFHHSLAQHDKIDLQGHRGCRGLMPENTISAMIKAIELGVGTIEMDVVVTKDKQVILSHDHFMNPEYVTAPTGKQFASASDRSHLIYQMNYSEVRTWDAGIKGNPKFPEQQKMNEIKPLLSSLIDSVEAYTQKHNYPPVRYNIETKSSEKTDGLLHPVPAEFIALLMQVIEDGGIANRTTIQSFDKRTLRELHQKFPQMKTAYLIGANVESNVELLISGLGFTPAIISPEFSLVTPKFITACHQKNMKVVVWTVNDRETIRQMADLGVDGIISDYPDRFDVLKTKK